MNNRSTSLQFTAWIALGLAALVLPYKTYRASLFGPSPNLSHDSLWTMLDWNYPFSILLAATVFLPALAVLVSSIRVSSRGVRILIAALMGVGGGYEFWIGTSQIFESDVSYKIGFYLFSGLILYAFYRAWRSAFEAKKTA